MKNLALIMVWAISTIGPSQSQEVKKISKQGMTVSWWFKNNRIIIEMEAPTDGWVAIGFNPSSEISGTYLLMGHIIKGKVEVVEHYTFSPGDYGPITQFGKVSQVKDITGQQNRDQTIIRFSLPQKAISKYQQNLTEGLTYHLLLAYSQEDDFQHHSIMRTSVEIKL